MNEKDDKINILKSNVKFQEELMDFKRDYTINEK